MHVETVRLDIMERANSGSNHVGNGPDDKEGDEEGEGSQEHPLAPRAVEMHPVKFGWSVMAVMSLGLGCGSHVGLPELVYHC
jgi:hypothetical protein